MKITKQKLREIIKEELSSALDEPVTEVSSPPWDGDFAREQQKGLLNMIHTLKVRLARVEKELGKPWTDDAAEAYAVDVGE